MRLWVPNCSSTSCDLGVFVYQPSSRLRRRKWNWDGGTAVVPPRPAIMPDDHRPGVSQVTAVDDQFGTHTPGQCRAVIQQ
jgi:hypothetical protein